MFPDAIDPSKVGHYPASTKSGGGFFYDEVLEYRVWVHAKEGEDHFFAFSDYDAALDFSKNTEGAGKPLVLVLQKEHVNEPESGVFEHVKGDRITEWLPEWLEGVKRGKDTIEKFLKEQAK